LSFSTFLSRQRRLEVDDILQWSAVGPTVEIWGENGVRGKSTPLMLTWMARRTSKIGETVGFDQGIAQLMLYLLTAF